MSNPALDSDPSHPKAPTEPPREQRRHPRFELAVRCWITDSRHTLYLRVHDISRGGSALSYGLVSRNDGLLDWDSGERGGILPGLND